MSRPNIPGFPINQNTSVTQTDYRTPETEPLIWAHGRQRPVVSEGEQRSILAAAGMVGAAVFAAGAIPLPGQKGVAYAKKTRIWDKYIGAAKFVERASPAQILSTFRVSEALSPLERVASGQTTWGGQFWDDPSRQKYLGKLLGKDVFTKHKDDILSRGLVLSEGKLRIGADVSKRQGLGATVLSRANKLRTHRQLGQAEFFKNYVRAIGADDLKFSTKEFLPIGGRNIAHAYARYGYTSVSEMTNRILRVSPTEIAELPVMRDLADKIKSKVGPKVQGSLAAKVFNKVFPEIKPGAAHQTIGRYLTRRVLPGVALWKGFQLADYATGNLISGTVLGGYAQAKVMKAKLMEATGMQEYATRQEEIAPGSTSLLGLAAFPLKGAMLGFGAYGARLAYTAREAMKPGVGAAEAALIAANKFKEKNYNTFFGIGKKLGFKQRNLSSALRRTGGLLGLAFAAPFFPGAIAGTETSEELAAIYSGEKEVAIRKGRFWEAGRCLMKSTTCKLFRKNDIRAEDVKIGDVLVGRGYRKAKVIDIYTRDAKETMYSFSSAFDRDNVTALTGNHIVPIIRKGQLIEEEAANIRYGDFVETPFRRLKNNVKTIDVVDFIDFPVIAQAGKIYSAQKNWHTGNYQKSGKHSIDAKVALDADIGRLFGYFLAEGNLSFRDGKVPQFIETVHAVSEKWIVDDIVKICEKHFNVTPTFKHRLNFTKAIEGAWIVRICSSILAKLFYGLFYNNDHKANDKCIPRIFLDAPDEFKRDLIEGYWRGDGHLDKFAMIISSSRKHLLEDVRLMALNLGMLCGIGPKEENGFKGKWRLRFYTKSNCPNRSMQVYNGRLFSVIRKVETYDYDDIVYDFEIDDEDHLFVAGTFLVHNSPYEGGRIQYFRKHFIPSYLSRGKVKALYGSEGQKILNDPIYNPIGYLMDPYKWEKEHYYEFPFPVTAPAFEDVPFIGPMLAATIGQIVKPSKLMHTEEWMRQVGPSFGPAGFGPGIAEPGQMSIPIGQMRGELEGYGYGPGQMEVKKLPRPFGETSAFDLGEIPRGIPVDPYSPTQVFGEQAYRLTEMFGLPGYSLTVAKGMLTGTEEFYDQYERLESASRATGIERAYWDLQIGGGALSTELFRRLYPHRRRGIDLFNPIKNTMPGWLPGPGQPSPDFQHGFAFGKILEGELRLPGRGMEALYPELEGIDPKNYSLMWRYKILSDVSPYSPQTKFYKQMVQGLRKQGTLNERDEQLYQTIQDQLQQKKIFKEFREHKQFIDSETETRTVTISKMIEPGKFEIEEMPGVTIAMAGLKTSQSAFSRMAIKENNELTQQEAGIRANQRRMRASRELAGLGVAAGTQVEIEITGDVLRQYAKTKSDKPEIRAVVRTGEGVNLNRMLLEAELAEYDKASAGQLTGQIAYNPFEQLVGAYWETGIRAIDDPSEYLTPFSPFHKFLGTKTRTAVEEYAAAEAYGTSAAFWDRPWENFLRPMLHYAGYKYAGMRELPQHIKERNEIEEYFDKLKYIKFTRLKNLALTQGDTEAAEEYEKVRRRTAFGADPYGNPLNGLLAMQKRDKPYFDAFARASTESERELIMDMLPKHERHLVQARWNLDMMNQLFAERKIKGSLSTEQHEMLEELHRRRISEGQAVDPSAMADYKNYTDDVSEDIVMSYADFQRERSLEDYFKSHPLPRNDFVGFHPQTDLEDIKLVVVKNEGRDMHDFNLWESREKTLPYKPYIDEDAIEQVTHMEGDMSAGDMRATLHDILASYGVENVNITIDKFLKKDPQNIIDLDITRDSLQVGFENAVKEGWI